MALKIRFLAKSDKKCPKCTYGGQGVTGLGLSPKFYRFFVAFIVALAMDNDDLVVIGAGLPRTGTLSTRAALERLVGLYRISYFDNKCYPEEYLIVQLTR